MNMSIIYEKNGGCAKDGGESCVCFDGSKTDRIYAARAEWKRRQLLPGELATIQTYPQNGAVYGLTRPN